MARTEQTPITRAAARRWKELGKSQRLLVAVLAVIDGAGKSAAFASLARTPKEKVRGPKMLWTPIIASVNTLGWIAWFAYGRRN